MQAGQKSRDLPRRSKIPHPRGCGFEFPDSGEIAEKPEEVVPQLDNARFRLNTGIVNLVTTVYIRAKL